MSDINKTLLELTGKSLLLKEYEFRLQRVRGLAIIHLQSVASSSLLIFTTAALTCKKTRLLFILIGRYLVKSTNFSLPAVGFLSKVVQNKSSSILGLELVCFGLLFSKSLLNSKLAFVCCSDEQRGWVCNNIPKSKNCVSTSPYGSSFGLLFSKALENSKLAFVCCSNEQRGWVCYNSPKSKN